MCVCDREKETFLLSYLQKRNKFGSTALENAVQAVDTEIVEVLLACGSDVNERNGEGRTPLHLAALRGSVKTMELLVKYGSDLNAVDVKNRTVLHCAVFSEVFEAVSFVIRHGGSESCNESDFYWGATPLQCAMLELNGELVMKLIPLFLENGWDILTTNNSGRTALHVAANWVWDNDQNDECVTSVLKLLMEEDSDVTATDDEGNTALHLAAQINAKNCLEIIEFASNSKKGCPSTGKNPKPSSLHIRNAKGRTPLLETAATVLCDHENVITLLLARGCDIQATDRNGLTPLHIAAAHWNLDIARILVEHGADVNAVDKDGNTPLHVAASMPFQEHLDFLVERGADINKRNEKGVQARIGKLGDASLLHSHSSESEDDLH